MLLKLRSLDWQPQYHLGTCWKNKFSGSTLNLLSQTLLMSPSNLCLTSFPDDSEACSCLRTTVTAQWFSVPPLPIKVTVLVNLCYWCVLPPESLSNSKYGIYPYTKLVIKLCVRASSLAFFPSLSVTFHT